MKRYCQQFYLPLLCSFLLCLTGCFETKKSEEMTLFVRTKKATNNGTPLYVVIKETNMAKFLTQDYQEIASQSFWKEEEAANVVKKVLIPGTTNKITLPVPAKDKSLGIYFLFTKPGECWKYIISKPKAEKIKILLGEQEYEAVNVFE
jgi:predicted component of type VI protein secretion system